jgi:hypothetical protein
MRSNALKRCGSLPRVMSAIAVVTLSSVLVIAKPLLVLASHAVVTTRGSDSWHRISHISRPRRWDGGAESAPTLWEPRYYDEAIDFSAANFRDMRLSRLTK